MESLLLFNGDNPLLFQGDQIEQSIDLTLALASYNSEEKTEASAIELTLSLGSCNRAKSRKTRSHRGPRKRGRRSVTQSLKLEGKSSVVQAIYPWARERRAEVHSLEYLLSRNIRKIVGKVQCKKCEKEFEMELDLEERFVAISNFIAMNKEEMHDRAPERWANPALLDCGICREKRCVKHVVAQKKREINWLFLMLSELLGTCTLEQIKYFCKHTENHRTGAKDRVLYLAYMTLYRQLISGDDF